MGEAWKTASEYWKLNLETPSDKKAANKEHVVPVLQPHQSGRKVAVGRRSDPTRPLGAWLEAARRREPHRLLPCQARSQTREACGGKFGRLPSSSSKLIK